MRHTILLALACLGLAACAGGSIPGSPAPQTLDAGRTSNSSNSAPGTVR